MGVRGIPSPAPIRPGSAKLTGATPQVQRGGRVGGGVGTVRARAGAHGMANFGPSRTPGDPIRDTAYVTRLMGVMLALCATLLGLLVVAVAIGAGRAAPLPHPEYAPMQVGIDAGELGAPAWAAYVAGIAMLGTMWVTMLIGFRDGHWIRRAVNAWSVGYVLLFVILMWSFEAYAAGDTTIILGFTAPTSILVYGLTLAPWIPLIAITWVFDGAYFGPAEQARFDEIVAQSREGRGSSHDARSNIGGLGETGGGER